MFCPNCNTENRDGAKFCNECGKPLPQIEEQLEDAQPQDVEDIPAALQDEAPVETDDSTLDGNDSEECAASDADEGDDADTADDVLGEDASDAVEEGPSDLADDDGPGSGDAAGDGSTVAEEGQGAGEGARPKSPVNEADVTQVIPLRGDQAAFEAGATVAIDADLSGFDTSPVFGESFLDPNYQEPVVNWRDGGTMKLPRVEGEEPRKGTDFLTSSAKKKRHTGRWVALGIAAVVIVVAAIVFATYQMQLWGGKAIPNVVGMTQVDAEQMLTDQGFSVRSTQVKSDDTEGLVLIMDPSAGTRADEGAEVVIHLATARVIPEAVGNAQSDVEAACAEEGFEDVAVVQEPSDEPAGTVLAIDPEAGTHAKSSQTITLTVARPRTVPAVEGMLLEDAQAAIAAEGLESYVAFVNTEIYPEGQIMGTDPIAGAEVTADQSIAILIARARGQELIGLTQTLLYPGATVSIGMYSYEIQSLDSVEYLGNDTVSYVCTARPFTSILGETVYVSARTISGQIVWTEGNTVASMT